MQAVRDKTRYSLLAGPSSRRLSGRAHDPSAVAMSHSPLSLPHVAQVLQRHEVDVEEPVDTVGQAALLVLVERAALDAAGDALLPADVGEDVCFCGMARRVRSEGAVPIVDKGKGVNAHAL